MYEAFFTLTSTPFTRGLPPAQLLTTPVMEEAGVRLDYAARERRFAVLTGEVGVGKSTALRAFLARLPVTRYTPLYVTDSQLTPRNFYHEALWQLGLPPRFYRGDARRQLHRALQERDDAGKQPVIVIDEAHLLGRAMLEEVRFLLNFDVDSRAPLALILAGQSELRRTLKLDCFTAIAQRISLRAHLPALTPDESAAYIQHHLAQAGAVHPLFTEPALRVIHAFAGGLPRQLNNVCTACLLSAYGQHRHLIDDAIAREVIDTEFA
jgi:type II secretory pathway predicted ATPase ExeA